MLTSSSLIVAGLSAFTNDLAQPYKQSLVTRVFSKWLTLKHEFYQIDLAVWQFVILFKAQVFQIVCDIIFEEPIL